jgi:hypothetical protein
MTLKERLQEENVYINAYNFKLTKECAEKFEEIADEFAIVFAKWLRENDIPENAEKYFGYSDSDMLEEFKKEKGL